MTGLYETNEVVNFPNSYSEKSSKYATYQNLKYINFIKVNLNLGMLVMKLLYRKQ